MPMLRTLLAFAALLSFSLASVQLAGAQTREAGYRFSPVNQYDIPLMAAYWNPIVQYVSDKSGVKLTLRIARTSADTTAYVLTQEVEFVFSNHLFSPEREQLGWKVFGRRQVPPITGQIVVPEDSPITRLEQLKGQEVAFAGPEAFLIYKVPYAHLLNSGIDIKVVFGGNQNGALAQLFAGKAQAAGGNSQLIEGYAKREGKKFRVLWSSEPFNDLALMVSGKVPEKDARAVATAFLTMHDDPAGRQVLQRTSQMVGLPADAHFIPASSSDYTAYRRFYQSAPPQLR
jgi:phosphonate transport system substrate-binding protein